ncbi:MAG: hypothetical protein US86_C0015G0014 [Candidatus Daviesbacteria bacterium GW2011_GWA2_38_24]|uniref:Uncharacterized protein n=2 Tax=Patescibacteria group TaxID=1783273 RepID=A0A1F6YB37_9BACT|nr:MAG: hypothetical protein US86_C0015G0014 [Candidatus Daviesbacteria bacterium GW2011_GWA2_38_24]OGI80053.1 MAG: hypothetical protein A3D43_01455 [Candidatus Nomurabacteria bacterium RIFCSPHIGHO2_02_FULL_41_52]OGI85303.1 MAG: hypothetical protein A3F49_01215 [Candidatus Nomurabacteria bacterium RIFCSPHIGHO2_12_FULL_42_19]OGI94144.1 MAG: hypothetical protein A3A07_00905 [Candidatus Nomurabacteria bacterium RIFCSPLOWO2_01_FULL_41_52]OGI98966.1 MAG: hypothetical protein A3H56_00365 [Candidatus 
MYLIKLNEKLYLTLLLITRFNTNFFNTNDIAILANKYYKELVRAKKFKKDYKYLEDTNFGGLRGNLSTILTLRGLVKRGSRIIATYSLGNDFRLKNAIQKGEVILGKDFTVKTNSSGLKDLLEKVDQQHSLREAQAHVKQWLNRNKSIPIKRDNDFPKDAVFKTENNKFLFRILFNNFLKGGIFEYHLLSYWEGNKIKRKNMHIFFAVPIKKNPFGELFFIKVEDLFLHEPLFLEFNNVTKECKDKNGNTYKVYSLENAIEEFSDQYGNEVARLAYSWKELKEKFCEQETELEVRKENESNSFINLFLDWSKKFRINGKDVIDVVQIGSSGPDIELIFSGGTKQKVELEHTWSSYFNHGHQNNNAFKNVWIFAEEPWDASKVFQLFKSQKVLNGDRVPDVFLCIDNGIRKVYQAKWEKEKFLELPVVFK